MPKEVSNPGVAGGMPGEVHVKAGEYIFREGESGDVMFIVKTGSVLLLKQLEDEDLHLMQLEEGDFFGEMAILEDEPRASAARAQTDCELLRVDRATFDQIVRHYPEIPVRMLRILANRLQLVLASGGQLVLPTAEPEPAARPDRPAGGEPREPAAPVAGMARLVHAASRAEFALAAAEETLIGRFDANTGFQPHIDLREIDPTRSTSRRHARVLRRRGAYYLRQEIGVTNGTFVNGKSIATGDEMEIRDGDEVTFGRVRTVFRT